MWVDSLQVSQLLQIVCLQVNESFVGGLTAFFIKILSIMVCNLSTFQKPAKPAAKIEEVSEAPKAENKKSTPAPKEEVKTEAQQPQQQTASSKKSKKNKKKNRNKNKENESSKTDDCKMAAAAAAEQVSQKNEADSKIEGTEKDATQLESSSQKAAEPSSGTNEKPPPQVQVKLLMLYQYRLHVNIFICNTLVITSIPKGH